MIIDPQYIENLASKAFWNFVYHHSLKETNWPTKSEDIPKKLWSRDILIRMMTQEGLLSEDQECEKELIDTLYYEVVETIIKHCQKDQNIIGVVYTEDFQFCKDPNFEFDDFVHSLKNDSDKLCGYDLKLKGKYLTEGDFLLRTPLPSGILLKSDPKKNGVYISNTLKAFGFQKTILLSTKDTISLPDNEYGYKYFVTGVFQLPTQQGPNEKWIKLIPNVMCVLKGAQMFSSTGTVHEIEIIDQPVQKSKSIFQKILNYFN